MEPLVVVVRVVHALYVAFVVTAPALRWSGAAGAGLGATSGVGRLHLACLGFVTLQFACGWSCPLTRLEEWLAGTDPGSFVVPSVTPMWAWLFLALLWAASLATERAAVSGHRAGMEAA